MTFELQINFASFLHLGIYVDIFVFFFSKCVKENILVMNL